MSIELDRQNPFYEGTVPVRVEREQDGTKSAELTFRILPGVKVSEEEFHDLKSEQSLLVDFASFPPKFVELLDACKNGIAGTGQFIAVLDLSSLPTFKIVEANQFKQLTHLALRFQPGTDATIKVYLAARLQLSQKEAQNYCNSLENQTLKLQQETEKVEKLSETVKKLETESSRTRDELANQHAELMSKQKEDSLKLLSQTQNAASEQARKQQELSEKRIQELENQLTQLQLEHRKLYEAKSATDAENNQLQIRNVSLEKFTKDGTNEVNTLREVNRELESTKFRLEKQVSEQQLTIVALKQQLQDKDEVLAKTTVMLEQSTERRRGVEEKLNQYKNNTQKLQRKLELSIKEINKGNSAIEMLQGEVRQCKDKMKTKNIVIKQQEKVLDDIKGQYEDSLDARDKLKKELEVERSTVKDLKKSLEASKARLEECNQMLESNQNVISFLNKEINQAQSIVPLHGATSPTSPDFFPSPTNYENLDKSNLTTPHKYLGGEDDIFKPTVLST